MDHLQCVHPSMGISACCKSTTAALLETTDKWSCILEQGSEVAASVILTLSSNTCLLETLYCTLRTYWHTDWSSTQQSPARHLCSQPIAIRNLTTWSYQGNTNWYHLEPDTVTTGASVHERVQSYNYLGVLISDLSFSCPYPVCMFQGLEDILNKTNTIPLEGSPLHMDVNTLFPLTPPPLPMNLNTLSTSSPTPLCYSSPLSVSLPHLPHPATIPPPPSEMAVGDHKWVCSYLPTVLSIPLLSLNGRVVTKVGSEYHALMV